MAVVLRKNNVTAAFIIIGLSFRILGHAHDLRVDGNRFSLDRTTLTSASRQERTDRSALLLDSLVPSIVGPNRLDNKAIAPIGIAREPALVPQPRSTTWD